jgi:hypothetical protein
MARAVVLSIGCIRFNVICERSMHLLAIVI